MKVDIIISADDIIESKIEDKIVVVIDMFRATSVIVTALNNGCKEVVPYLTIEETLEHAGKLNRQDYILGGERRAVKIEEFDLSNSPIEYKKNVVENKTVLMTTTNGTRTLTKSTNAKTILIAAMINAKAVAEKLLEINEDVVIINAGTNGNFSMDDYICSGYIINEMLSVNNKIQLTDIARTANIIYEANTDIISYVKEASHYSVMKSLGLDEDIEYCMKKSIIDIVPEYKDKKITCL
ncbi:2-phosphosulfolactate phosphatase family protein [Clostridium saccharobutylicum]|uniref:Probable 2-phosphosulfolactate phosphatase n=1 Tax=Clostridium saccharobutylicum DSM 13864 TaxID=1345695 RepID=U5MJZ3_CLOSA|nr:2-phosphosulfolactate phosphatase family protein [Clostridium saccharobutylicum]AGX41129.1 2-phosphosulfolactate phosphatase ComB [Clostridium saccharobutylicum DSM 13864]AQR88414.1 putative 2-phosphosulfolactate phosphatase [Clostridium saccharobutylicum]AQR98312.1 putative 2-phosphosulfolactate phosphatase [Clostridium saccharobutylicum]AQS12302.1 putative 2-phosphosulfolactate phosphatase [Clostridium saccharobutylicum]MBA2906056.1 2-phosphosulfolactate phosphatase [Clostridium saccharob